MIRSSTLGLLNAAADSLAGKIDVGKLSPAKGAARGALLGVAVNPLESYWKMLSLGTQALKKPCPIVPERVKKSL